jgi:hypothetical protein
MNLNENNLIEKIVDKGFLDIPIPKNLNLINEIKKLKKEKNAVLLVQ